MNHRIRHQFTREQLCIVNLQPRPLGQQCVQPVSNSTHRGGLTGQPPDLHTARPVMGATSHHPAKANEVMAKRSRSEPARCPPLPEHCTSRRRQGCAERAVKPVCGSPAPGQSSTAPLTTSADVVETGEGRYLQRETFGRRRHHSRQRDDKWWITFSR